MRLTLIIFTLCLQSCGLLFGLRRDTACIQNNYNSPIKITTSPEFKSPLGYWEKFWQCPTTDSINENGNRIYYQNTHLRRNCVIKIEDQSIDMQSVIHNDEKKFGTYIINSNSIFYLGESNVQSWPYNIIKLKPDDLLYDSIQIIVPFQDTILLTNKQAIYNFLTSSKNTLNKKIDKKVNKNYSTIAVIK